MERKYFVDKNQTILYTIVMENINQLPAAPRTELMSLLDSICAAKNIIYIHAPAGYGKSFSARMWLKRNNHPYAWVAVNESAGRKPSELCRRFVSAFILLQPDNAELPEALKNIAAAPIESMELAINAFQLYNTLNNQDKQTVFLVIDDVHLITNSALQKKLTELLRELMENITLLLLSRGEPPKMFSEFILRDCMAVIDIKHLKFSEKETAAFFKSRGRKLTEQQVRDIMAATGGWAIGLNTLLLSDSQDYSRKKLSLYLNDFIEEQVWKKWTRERKDFLLKVSVAEELSPDFCNAMTARSDSVEILDTLVRENAFISVDSDGVYRFHHLFQDFLRNLLENENDKLKKSLYQTAGDWYYSNTDYYRAVECYIKCGSKKGIAKALTLMYNYNSPYASVEDTAAIIRLSVDNAVVEKYPFLLETLAWAAFVEGRCEEMERHIDSYNRQLPKVIMQNPSSALTAVLLRCMDYRNNLVEVLRKMQNIPFKKYAHANTPSITQNMPFFHRSGRDFSELLDNEAGFEVLRKTWGVLLKDEYEVVVNSIRAGLSYEQNKLDEARELALSACATVRDSFAPEIQFCAYMILSLTSNEPESALNQAADMIEIHKAYYLEANYNAFLCRQKLSGGDRDTANEWLKYNAEHIYNHLLFYKLYRYFTTARAYIVAGEYNTAVLFLKKLLALCERYRRPLDMTEACTLLAIAYWKKGDSGSQSEALLVLENAIFTASRYNYTRLFSDESAELSNMLHRLQKRVIQKDYSGKLTVRQVKSLYILTLPHAKISKGLTGGRVRENLTFTQRQKEVMGYLCEGLTHKEIAEKMGIKFSTVKSHTILIYQKLDVSNVTDAIVKIQELGLLK